MERRSFLLTAAAGSAATVSSLAPTAEAASKGAPDASLGLALPVPPQSAALGTAGANWSKVGGNYGNQNHSTLQDITPQNIKRLGGAWHINLEGGATSAYQQCTIVVQDGVLYVETTQQNVFAVNGRTGEVIWKTNLGTETTNMRGVAVAEGKVFTISGANIVYALDRKTERSSGRSRLSSTTTAATTAATTTAASAAATAAGWQARSCTGTD